MPSGLNCGRNPGSSSNRTHVSMIHDRCSNIFSQIRVPTVAYRIQQTILPATTLRPYTSSRMDVSSKAANDFLSFVNASPTRVYLPHAASLARLRLIHIPPSFPRCSVGQGKARGCRIQGNQSTSLLTDTRPLLFQLLIWCLGTRCMGLSMSARREVLPHAQRFDNLSFRNWEELEGW